MEHIIIIGFMGTGKSCVGKKLAQKLNRPWVDTDQEFEKREQMSINQYFQQNGESSFREQETQIIQELLTYAPLVLTTGGGIVLSKRNRDLLQQGGWVVELAAEPKTIIKRLKHERQTRPLLAGNPTQKIYELYQQRQGLYDIADYRVQTDSMTSTEVVQDILNRWKEKPV